MAEPVLGWRAWWTQGHHGDALYSLVRHYDWSPGRNEAACLAEVIATEAGMPWLPTERHPKHTVPGKGCNCGFWAHWELELAISTMRGWVRNRESPVLGLIQGWGEVAVHGKEGFRCRFARPLCLFTDHVNELSARSGVGLAGVPAHLAPYVGLGKAVLAEGLGLRSPEVLRRWHEGVVKRREELVATHREAVLRVARRYGVPALPLGEAARSGLLGEFGVPAQQVEQAARLLEEEDAR